MAENKTSILSLPETWNIVAEGYKEVTQPLFEQFSQQAVTILNPNSRDYALDIACGPGTTSLKLSPLVEEIQAIDFSTDMLQALEKNLSDVGITNVEYQEADGQNLPFDDEEFDLAISMFGWMFFPNRAQGLSEIKRCLKPHAQVALSSWLPRKENPLFELVTQTMMHINPKMKEPPKITNELELEENFKVELKDAGFKNIKTQVIQIIAPIESAEKFWENMERGNAPIAAMKKALPSRDWKKKSKKAIAFLKKHIQSEYPMRAWLAIAEK